MELATASVYAAIPEEGTRVHVACNVRHSSVEEWNVVLELERPKIV